MARIQLMGKIWNASIGEELSSHTALNALDIREK